MKHPQAEDLIQYAEDKLEQQATERVHGHLATCDQCLDAVQENLKEKLRRDLHGLREGKEMRPHDALDEEIRRSDDRLADEPAYRETAREMLSRFGTEKDPTLGPMLRLLNDFDERLATLRSERR